MPELRSETMTVNMGPQHPSTHGVLRLVLELDGETVVSVSPTIGYLHTGIEKTAEQKKWQQVIPLVERMDYLDAQSNSLAFVLSVEKLLGIEVPDHGSLEAWARQGVLLLNTTLTVRAGQAASHQGKGWEVFTDEVLAAVNAKPERVVFILWGASARRKKPLIDTSRHVIIESAHPSPLSARNGFFGSRPFSRANDLLARQGAYPVDWRLP